MTPSEVRDRILSEHAALRARLDEIESLAGAFRSGSQEAGKELRSRGLALYEIFAAHLQLEDATLGPALARCEPDGPERAEALARVHDEQRELLGFLSGRLERHELPSHLVAREMGHFVEYVREDMAYEEDALLDEAVLS